MKIIAFILDLSACVHVQAEREEVIRILRHLKMWPIEYPKPAAVDARASPSDFKLLQKLFD